MLKCFINPPSPYWIQNRKKSKRPYRVEDKCICRRREATGEWLSEEALGPKGILLLLLLQSPWRGSSPAALWIHWCATVLPASGFWTYLLLISTKPSSFLPAFLPPLSAECLSQLTQQRRAQHLLWTSPPVTSFPHRRPVGKEEALPLLPFPSDRYSRCYRHHPHLLPLGLQAPGSQPGRSIIKDACASEILTSLVQSDRSITVMSNIARRILPRRNITWSHSNVFYVRPYMFFCFQSSSESLCLCQLLRVHFSTVLLFRKKTASSSVSERTHVSKRPAVSKHMNDTNTSRR